MIPPIMHATMYLPMYLYKGCTREGRDHVPPCTTYRDYHEEEGVP